MSESDSNSVELKEKVKKLETLQRNTRIAIIILVGYSIYDVISKDSGSEIVYAHKIKAKEFELVDGIGTVFGTWKVLGQENRVPGLVIENSAGKQIRVTADGISLREGRTNPVIRAVLNEDGLQLIENVQSIEENRQ